MTMTKTATAIPSRYPVNSLNMIVMIITLMYILVHRKSAMISTINVRAIPAMAWLMKAAIPKDRTSGLIKMIILVNVRVIVIGLIIAKYYLSFDYVYDYESFNTQ